MFKKSVRVAAAMLGVGALGVTMAGTASAINDPSFDSTTNYSQHNTVVRCTNPSQGGDPGGTLTTRAYGKETRPAGTPFQIKDVRTYLQVQKYVGSDWQDFSNYTPVDAQLGRSVTRNGVSVAHWKYNGGTMNYAKLSATVPTSGTYRLKVWSALNNQDGLDLIPMHNYYYGPDTDAPYTDGLRGYMITRTTNCVFAG